MKPIKPWIKGGIVGAVVYPILNVLFLYLALSCGFSFNSSDFPCDQVEWSYWNLFLMEHIEDYLPVGSSDAWFVIAILIDLVIGFIIGALITKAIRWVRGAR